MQLGEVIEVAPDSCKRPPEPVGVGDVADAVGGLEPGGVGFATRVEPAQRRRSSVVGQPCFVDQLPAHRVDVGDAAVQRRDQWPQDGPPPLDSGLEPPRALVRPPGVEAYVQIAFRVLMSKKCMRSVSTAMGTTSPRATLLRGPNRATTGTVPDPASATARLVGRPFSDVLHIHLRTGHGEVDHEIGAERLAQLDRPRQPLILRMAGALGRIVEVLGPDPDGDRAPDVGLERRVRRHRLLGETDTSARSVDEHRATFFDDIGGEQVHGGRADEGGDEQVAGRVVEHLRRRDLLEDALAHDRDPITHGHRLDLVVRDVHRRDAEVALQLRHVGPHLHAQLGVEVRQAARP